uniref:Uncharacterized protein n=1 Tax=Arundo donax TaxID=35708 RepID=A0A0A9F869_ARUDO
MLISYTSNTFPTVSEFLGCRLLCRRP